MAQQEKLYIGTKLIKAIPMDECTFLTDIKGQDMTNKENKMVLVRDYIKETREGYKVTYPDGYVSWSPKETFEAAYREVTKEECLLLFH